MNRSRLIVGVAVAAVVVAAAAAAALLSDSVDDEPVLYSHEYPADVLDPVWLRIEDDDGKTRELTIEWGSLRTTFEHPGEAAVTYTFLRGAGRPEALQLTVVPDASITFGSGSEVEGEVVDLAATPWEAVEPDPSADLPEPQVAADGSSVSLAVDESYSYGLVVEGVSLRSEPNYVSDRVAVLIHGETYNVTCWLEMEEVTNGNNDDPSDDNKQYSTTTWWFVEDDVSGFVSDVWLGRTNGDRFGLAEC